MIDFLIRDLGFLNLKMVDLVLLLGWGVIVYRWVLREETVLLGAANVLVLLAWLGIGYRLFGEHLNFVRFMALVGLIVHALHWHSTEYAMRRFVFRTYVLPVLTVFGVCVLLFGDISPGNCENIPVGEYLRRGDREMCLFTNWVYTRGGKTGLVLFFITLYGMFWSDDAEGQRRVIARLVQAVSAVVLFLVVR